MKTLSPGLFVAVLALGAAVVLHAQDAGKERGRGKVLLLKNGHAMEGEVEHIGQQYCIRRGPSEIWIASDKAARLCADWDDAFRHVQSLIKPDDANDRVKLARWCHLNRMNERALEQARKALELQPTHADAKQIVTTLERAKLEPVKKPAAPPIVVAAPKMEPAPTVDVTSETMISFTTKVQPILMNTCATCHANGQGGAFVLDRVYDATQKASSSRNLAAVLSQVDLERPAISPLLVRAITPHGGDSLPAIKSRDAKPLQAMQQWIEQTVAKNPQLKDYRAVAKKPVQSEPIGFASQGTVRAARPEPKSGTPPKTTSPVTPVKEAPPAGQAVATPTDDFDPVIFNRHFHANRK
jgi:hypothetical protein